MTYQLAQHFFNITIQACKDNSLIYTGGDLGKVQIRNEFLRIEFRKIIPTVA